MTASGQLACRGGVPVRTDPFPSVADISGRRIGAEEMAAVERVLQSGRLSVNGGTEVHELEREFANMLGARHAVACSSGTAALHLALGAVNPEPGDEVITTPLSDGGTVLPIIAQNAVPVFADVDRDTCNLSADAVAARITPRTRAIIAVHLFGVPAPVDDLAALASQHGLVLIEDCAQAYLTDCAGRLAGTVGHIGCFSLQQSKHITAGDGGLAVTDDPVLARQMRLFSDKGWPRDTGERTHVSLGLNYRMTELQGAVARAQLPKLASIVSDRRRQAARLRDAIADLAGLTMPSDPARVSYYLFPILLDTALAGGTSGDYAQALVAEGAPAIEGYLQHPLHTVPMLTKPATYGTSGFPLSDLSPDNAPAYGAGTHPNAEDLVARRLLVLAWNENYTDRDVDDIAVAVRKVHAAFTNLCLMS